MIIFVFITFFIGIYCQTCNNTGIDLIVQQANSYEIQSCCNGDNCNTTNTSLPCNRFMDCKIGSLYYACTITNQRSSNIDFQSVPLCYQEGILNIPRNVSCCGGVVKTFIDQSTFTSVNNTSLVWNDYVCCTSAEKCIWPLFCMGYPFYPCIIGTNATICVSSTDDCVYEVPLGDPIYDGAEYVRFASPNQTSNICSATVTAMPTIPTKTSDSSYLKANILIPIFLITIAINSSLR
jgi:hypothetical protein